MEGAKRIKLEYCITFENLPSNIITQIIRYLSLNDKKNLGCVNNNLQNIVYKMLEKQTYLYVTKKNAEELAEVPFIKRDFCEIFFHGIIRKDFIDKILYNNGNRAKKLMFGKSDLNFIKISYSDISTWLKYFEDTLQILNTLNIDVKGQETGSSVCLKNLRKLRCCDTMLCVIDAPVLDDLVIFTKDKLTPEILDSINNFLIRHTTIKKFTFKVFCGEDIDVQKVDFKLDHLKLTHLTLSGFRCNPTSVLNILKKQRDIIELNLQDGYITEGDISFMNTFEPVFNELLKIKKVEKLKIEMPPVSFLRKLKTLTNLKKLHIHAITHDIRAEIRATKLPNLAKLSIEGIELGKQPLSREDIWSISQNFINIHTLKIDSAPFSIIECMLKNLVNLKQLEIFRNTEIIRKNRIMSSENVQLPQTRLEKLIFEHEDFKIRIMPIIRVSPELKHIKIFWDNKQTPIISTIWDILENCSKINLIEFKMNGIYAKDDMISFKSHLNQFSFNNMNFQILSCRKNARIRCSRI